jgi:hypothetical protein
MSFVVAALALGACEDDTQVVDLPAGSSGAGGSAGSGAAGGSGGASGSGATGGSAGSGGSAGVAGNAGTAGSGGAAGSAGSDAGADADAGGPKFAEIQSMSFTVECAVDAGADQVAGEFLVLYDNSQGSGASEVLLSKVDLVLEQGLSAMKWNIKPTPAASGTVDPGQTSTVKHLNITGTGTGTADPCNFCNGTMRLEVEFTSLDDAGAVQTDTFGPQPVVCNQ